VLVVAVHGLAQVHEVGEHSLLGAFTSHLREPQPTQCRTAMSACANEANANTDCLTMCISHSAP
jgi:hypothetical protein